MNDNSLNKKMIIKDNEAIDILLNGLYKYKSKKIKCKRDIIEELNNSRKLLGNL
ncbi:Uncharacterised protein [[Clostridium] sordellii]|uniref:hypothetical protein n=1 Tax=Paraclostridium sordellii TaxID=1505 RepID=UPI0005E9F204|nr:hypothetical protein [Paeniclostridium sordellii]CEP97582.1 Uncharacterised protein [[Clostridium] sordellii] [Paeniclostridium sordellii]